MITSNQFAKAVQEAFERSQPFFDVDLMTAAIRHAHISHSADIEALIEAAVREYRDAYDEKWAPPSKRLAADLGRLASRVGETKA